jgi:hypothetical protein
VQAIFIHFAVQVADIDNGKENQRSGCQFSPVVEQSSIKIGSFSYRFVIATPFNSNVLIEKLRLFTFENKRKLKWVFWAFARTSFMALRMDFSSFLIFSIKHFDLLGDTCCCSFHSFENSIHHVCFNL